MIGTTRATSVGSAVPEREERSVAMLVVLVPASKREPSLQPAAVSELARLGVTSVDLLRDERIMGLVLEGWAFDPSRSADAVIAAVGCRRAQAQVLKPLLHVTVSAAAVAGQAECPEVKKEEQTCA
jgi:hypothetical protein